MQVIQTLSVVILTAIYFPLLPQQIGANSWGGGCYSAAPLINALTTSLRFSHVKVKFSTPANYLSVVCNTLLTKAATERTYSHGPPHRR